ncbi:testis-expressed protein 19 [Octodon degus]|uniref:Testis-expressed protein 19 n=1 Tax=Octodon degus TaxID=10160 RepID=A0A6P3FKL2_OCTDE|nr:testis-expressed protein 19 [Octodon degus]
MCPPVVVRQSREGMVYLYASWLYELQHGIPLEVCFTCFKVAFLDLKDMLESDDWEDEEWDPMELDEAEHEQAVALGPAASWGPWSSVSASQGSEEEYLDDPVVPTELEPQSAVPLSLGSEHSDWTQALPWRFEGLPACSHWPSPPPLQVFPSLRLAPVEPMVLELGTMWPLELEEAEAWLLGLQVFCVVAFQGTTIYLRKMKPCQALRNLGQRWKVLLEPTEVWVLKLQETAQPHNLLKCQLSILEKTQHSEQEQLFPAYAILQKKGFTIVSYLPRGVNQEHSAPGLWFPTWSPDTGFVDSGSYVSRSSIDSLAVTGVLALGELSSFQQFGPELEY